VEKEGEQYRLEFEDGTVIGTRYLIGADGIRSTVRTALFQQSQLRDSGQICWRGLTHFHLPEAYHHTAMEAWGRGKRFGFVRINEVQVYWYALVKKGKGNETMDLAQAFDDFHPLVLQLLRATGKEAVFFSDLLDLKPIPAWSLPNVCLLGDAAHATTPNLGQGACQAIEDAYVLGQLLKKQTITEAFANYPAIRRAKVQYVVDTSWSLGKIAHWENRFSVALRNGILKLTPEKINQKQLSKLFALETV
jgi:2-polyprenyl-6-methoxyphenol hydroxylase-like FAD-dependent oxidoreductase